MKKFNKVSIIILSVAFIFCLTGLIKAATTVNLGTADSFAVLGGTAITNTGSSVITGDIGSFPTADITGFPPGTVSGTNHAGDATTQSAKTDLTTAYNNAAGQTPVTTVATELGGTTKNAGIYNSASGTFELTGTLTLDGQGNADSVFIFKTATTLVTAGSSSIVLINGAQPCNVFWQVGSSATLGANSTFKGNILALTSATLTTGANVEGRVLARNGAVTLDSNIVTKASCSVASTTRRDGTINVVKLVINDNGGKKTISDFPLFVSGRSVLSGVSNSFSMGDGYFVTETSDPKYTQTISGDCDSSGRVNVGSGDNKYCIITNNDIGAPVTVLPVPPIIDVVKVPSPLALPNGPGNVKYTYTLRNMGTVPVTDVTMVGDTCSPIKLVSGDINDDAKLDVNETWVYNCSTTLSKTHTNIVTATGWANGISTTDIASATVVVGSSLVPPIIHITKVPNPLTLPIGGGPVTYTYTVTNPGTAPLHDVSVTDDKCSGLPGRVVGHPGDVNKNDLLESNEIWSFTCQTNLKQTTTNIGTAIGSANGMTARDFAVATVVVATPKLPNTGIFSELNSTLRNIIILIIVLAIVAIVYFTRKKKAI